MQRLIRVIDKMANASSRVLVAPCVVTLVAWVLLFGAFIVGRTFFGINWTFVEEFTAYGLVLIVSFSLAYTLRTGGHIKIDIVTKLLSERTRSILTAITNLAALVVVIYLTQKAAGWLCYGLVEQVHSMYPSNVLLWPVYLLLPIGLAFLGLELLREFCHSLIGITGKRG